METSCLRLRFTPLFKNIRKNASKCCLEIVPEVSYIHNLDKVEWHQGDNSIEYTIPITYKVILKKKDAKCKANYDRSMKTYHSCVDLLIPSSVCDMDVGYGDLTKIISDTVIVNKLPDNDEDKTVVKKHLFSSNKVKTNQPKRMITSSTEPTTAQNYKKCKGRAIDDEYSQFLENLHNFYASHIQKIYLIDKVTSTNFAGDLRNQNTSAEVMSHAGTLDGASSFGGKIDRKLSITPICSINTNDVDNEANHVNGRTSNFIVLRIQEPHYNINFADNNCNKLRVSNDKCFKVIKLMNNKSFDSLTNESSERVLPEVRVAEFMKTLERELSPIKTKLNDIILKCALLGFRCKENPNPMLYSNVAKYTKDISWCKKEAKSNRVVYSIVFDG